MEIWKDVKGYDGLYKVSNLGRVKSLYINKIMNDRFCSGYKNLLLYKNGVSKSFLIHRLVSIAFIGNSENKPQVNHINGIKDDNRVENLEWCTISENVKHGYKLGLIKSNFNNKGRFGKNHPKSRRVKQFGKDGKFIKLWESLSDINRELGIETTLVSRVCRGKAKTTKGFIFKYI